MTEKNNIFKIEFEERHIQSMTPLDGILAVVYCILLLMMTQCFVLPIYKTDIFMSLMQDFDNKYLIRLLFAIPMTILKLLPIFLILYFRKQKISSIGFKKTKMIRSLFLGFLFGLPVILLNVHKFPEILFFIKNENGLTFTLLYYLLCISLVEEVVFRSFLSTRIQGIIKHKWMSIWIVGIVCALYHIPMQMTVVDMSLGNFILTNIPNLIYLTLLHIYFEYIYTRDNNIIAPIVTHTIFNLVLSA